MGMLKQRVQPEQIIINCSQGVPVSWGFICNEREFFYCHAIFEFIFLTFLAMPVATSF
jgi:hypothetical protein